MIKEINNLEVVIDFALELSENELYASYPRKESRTAIKNVLEKAIESKEENIIAYYRENTLLGLCIYFWKPLEKYAQTSAFLIKENYDVVADELIKYLGNHLSGYELYIGMPFTNKNAEEYFNKKSISCIESSIDTRLYNLKSPIPKNHPSIEWLNEKDFQQYGLFHDKYALPLEMYYNSTNLKKDLQRFRIFVFKDKNIIHGSIFVKVVKDMAEVFGLFIDEEYKNKGIESLLINEMMVQLYNEFGEIKELVYFIDENCTDELTYVLNAGFHIKDKYRCYKLNF